WFVLQNRALLASVVLDVAGDFGTRADEAHFAAEYIPKLREFVEFGATKEPAERCDTRIIVPGDGRSEYICVRHHGPEFPDKKRNSILADSSLAKKDRTALAEFNRERDEKKKRAE